MTTTSARPAIVFVAALVGVAAGAGTDPRPEPFAFLSPDVVVDAPQRAKLAAGGIEVRVLPGRDGFVSIFAAIRTEASGDRLLAWGREIERLQKGKYVPEIGRFSDPPRVEDLAGLVIENDDLDEIRRCRPGDCGVKLSAGEIAQMQRVVGTRDWKPRLALEIKHMLVQRARAYLVAGDAGAAPYHDDPTPLSPGDVFTLLLQQRLQFLPRHFGCLATYLRRYPERDAHVAGSFLYWSKESLGGKPIITLTHLTLARFDEPWLPEAVVVAKQVFATHYKNGSVTVTAITRASPERYLVYVHRSQVDVIHGIFGGLVRRMIERRVRSEAPGVLSGLRTRLESDPRRGQ